MLFSAYIMIAVIDLICVSPNRMVSSTISDLFYLQEKIMNWYEDKFKPAKARQEAYNSQSKGMNIINSALVVCMHGAWYQHSSDNKYYISLTMNLFFNHFSEELRALDKVLDAAFQIMNLRNRVLHFGCHQLDAKQVTTLNTAWTDLIIYFETKKIAGLQVLPQYINMMKKLEEKCEEVRYLSHSDCDSWIKPSLRNYRIISGTHDLEKYFSQCQISSTDTRK